MSIAAYGRRQDAEEEIASMELWLNEVVMTF